MKNSGRFIRTIVSLIALFAAVPLVRGQQSTNIWTGGGGANDLFWLDGVNWQGGSHPPTGAQLIFTNTVGLINSNSYPAGQIFAGFTFATPSGAFALSGNGVTLTNNITDLQVVTPESVNLPVIVNSPFSLNLNVAGNGVLNLNNVISGTGALTNSGAGTVNLNGNNTFTGPLVINGGTVVISLDTNLPAPPASPSTDIVLNGGALKTAVSIVLNTNRNMLVGSPSSPGGSGTILVTTNSPTNPLNFSTVTYGGVIADNTGGSGGLSKSGIGGLTLFGQNTYTGTTSNEDGTITLDFSQTTSPQTNIISPSSRLVFGGANAGIGNTNYAQLAIIGKASTINTQAFNSTHINVGNAYIRVASGTSGEADLGLGSLDHDVGGVLILTPPTILGGTGNITTTANNVNGILGGFATISSGSVARGWPVSTNWASVDVNGNIVNYTGFTAYNNANAYMSNVMAAANNIYVTGITTTYSNAPDGAGTTNDVNSIYFNQLAATADFDFGSNNVIRLGQYGGLFKYDTTAGVSNIIGGINYGNTIFTNSIYTNWSYDQASAGQLTAGGPVYGTPGEIVLLNTSTASGGGNNWNIDCSIVDNGPGGTVSVIKAGSGYIKLRNHNKFTGSFYVFGGRIQPTGTDTGSANLQDAFGVGSTPIVIFPGGTIFWGSVAGNPGITNAALIAGFGSAEEPGLGALRGGDFSGSITLIGDAQIAAGNIEGPISGPFNLTLCASSTAAQSVSLLNTNNSWTGNTTIIARQDSTGTETLTSSNSEVIPNGFGFGNVTMQAVVGQSARAIAWNLNGFNETINGLSSIGAVYNGTNCIIENLSPNPSTLTVGDNEQGGVFGGSINGSSTLALTKIGGGIETLTNINTYAGNTTISNGVLQLGGSGSINNSPNVNIDGGTFDVSSLSYTIPATQNINVSGGTFLISIATSSGGPVNFINGTLEIGSLTGGSLTPALTVQTVNLGGANNFIQPASIFSIPAYPVAFPIIQYTTLNGDPTTFSPILPSGGFPAFAGYITNYNSTIYLVLTNGPVTPQLTWFGSSGGALDSLWNKVDNNWTNIPAHSAASYADGSLVIFDDTAKTNLVNLNIDATPLGITITNVNLNYTLIGSGGLHGAPTNFISKTGTGKLTLDNQGTNDLSDAISIGVGGTVQVGVNDAGGGLGAGTLANNGTLVFNRNNAVLTVANTISGSGGILLSNTPGTTTILSGNNNNYLGNVYVAQGVTLAVANANALSSTNGSLTIPTGSTLDFSDLSASASSTVVGKMVYVAGAGVDGLSGAIVNNAATNQDDALLQVTLTNDTTFGGNGLRWDIRSTLPTQQPGVLSTGGNAYNLAKTGACFISIANINVDPKLNNVDVQAGALEINGSTTGMGTNGTLTVESNATLQVYNMTNTTLNKNIVLNGNGSAITLNNALGNNTITGPMTFNGSVSVNGAGTSTLTLSNTIGGTGSLTDNGSNTLVLAGNDSYSGGTTINAGTFIMNGVNNSSGNVNNELTVNVGTTVGGNGTYTVPVDIEAVLWPGVGGKPSTLNLGNNVVYVDQYSTPYSALTFGAESGTPTNIFSLNTATTVGGGVNDLINVTGTLGANGTQIIINPLSSLLTGSTYTLVTYSGGRDSSYNGSVQVVASAQPSRYQFSLDQVSTPNKVLLTVSTGVGTMEWNDAAGNSVWDVGTTLNWTNTSTATPVNPTDYQFYQEDNVVLDDSIANTPANTTLTITNEVVTNNIITAVLPASITVNSTNNNYTINGVGKISGNVNIIKEGPSMFTIGNTNDFTGTVMVSGGTLQVGNAAGLGDNSAALIITNTGIFNINGQALTNKTTVIVSGAGDGNGAIVNNVTPVVTSALGAFQNITLAGNTTFGGNSRWDMRTGTGILSTGGNPFNLTKVGTNYIAFDGVTIDTNLGNIDIQGGTLSFQQATTSMGNPASSITMEAGATLDLYNSTTNLQSFTKQFILNGDGLTASITNENGMTVLNGNMTLNNSCIIGVSGTALTNNCVISGSGSLTKNAGATLILTTNETYTGNTTVSVGTLSLLGNGSIANSTNITVSGGATIDVSGRVNGTLTLNGGANQTLIAANNSTNNTPVICTINGNLTNSIGATVTLVPNSTNLAVLTITTNATLLGTTALKLDAGNATNDVLSAGGNLVYGGTLTVTNISATPLSGGQSFKLFNAATYSGLFGTVNLPVLSAGLTWQNNLTVNGTISVLSSTPAVPHITGIILSGTTLTITATNGSNGGTWTLLQSTNVALPLSEWETNITGTFDGSGDLSTNIANTVSNAQEFYILKQ